jgi:hypothetical protein
MDKGYREANVLADLLDFHVDTAGSSIPEARERKEARIAKLRAELAERERNAGKPVDSANKRRGSTGRARCYTLRYQPRRKNEVC